jgi:predicted dehydrogenase
MLRVAQIGCGSVGQRRADIIAGDRDARLTVVSDIDAGGAAALAGATGAEAVADWRTAGLAALAAGKHVLMEKPLARTPEEAAALVAAAERAGRVLQTGFNHRWYPSIQQARRLVDEGRIGEVILLRCRYGHGARAGWEREWFTQPELSGGGTFLDNGVHALDLFRWFLGDFAEATGVVATLAWPVAPCEDNGVGIFRTADGRLALLHSSWTQWDPVFSFEITGREGFIHVVGREQVTLGGRGSVIGPVPTQTWSLPGPNESFADDWREFAAAIREGRSPLADGRAGLEAVRLAHAVYRASATGQTVRLSDV